MAAHAVERAARLEVLAKELTCPVCLRLFTSPVTKTKCNHYFCGGCITASMKHKQECPMCKTPARRRELDEDPLISRVVVHFTAVLAHEGMDVFLSQQPARGGGAAAPAAAASPSRYSTAPASLPGSAAAGGAAGAGEGPVARGKGKGKAAAAAARRGRGTAARTAAGATPAHERDAFQTPAAAAAAAAASPSPARRTPAGAPADSSDGRPPLFWLGARAPEPSASSGPAAEAGFVHDHDHDDGDHHFDDGGGLMDDDEYAGGADVADVAAAEQGGRVPSDSAAGGAGVLPELEGEGVAAPRGEEDSSMHVQCGQASRRYDDEAEEAAEAGDVADSGGRKRSKPRAAPKPTKASKAGAAPPPPQPVFSPPPPPQQGATPGAEGGAASRRPVRAAREDWPCGACTLLNPITVQRCNVCGTRRSTAADAEAAAAAMASPPARARASTPAAKRGRDGTPGSAAAAAAAMPPPSAPGAAKRRRKSTEDSPGGEKENGAGGSADAKAAAATKGKAAAAAAVAEAVAATPRAASAAKRVAAPKTPAAAAVGAFGPAAQAWVLTASGLDADQKTALKELAEAAGATYTRDWSERVTHVVAALDGQGRAPRTMKYMCALLAGQWVVSPSWAAACMAARAAAPEAPHEARGDVKSECAAGAPAAARARVAHGAKPLLDGVKVHFAGEFASPSRADLEALVLAGGGRVIRLTPSPPSPGKAVDPGLRVICEGSRLLAAGGGACAVGAPRAGRTTAVEAAVLATGAPALGHQWLIDSAASGVLQPTERYELRW